MSSSLELNKKNNSGFSIVELLITIAIVTLVTAIIMVRYSSFDSSILLNNQAYELALDVRETQVRSVSVRLSEDSVFDKFESKYGLFFNVADSGNYQLFVESNSNDRYDASELISTLSLDNRFEIDRIYFNNDTSIVDTQVSIYFERPNFDAKIYNSASVNYESAHIVIVSKRNPAGLSKTVSIYRSGQISVD